MAFTLWLAFYVLSLVAVTLAISAYGLPTGIIAIR